MTDTKTPSEVKVRATVGHDTGFAFGRAGPTSVVMRHPDVGHVRMRDVVAPRSWSSYSPDQKAVLISRETIMRMWSSHVKCTSDMCARTVARPEKYSSYFLDQDAVMVNREHVERGMFSYVETATPKIEVMPKLSKTQKKNRKRRAKAKV